MLMRRISIELGLSQRRWCAISYTNYSNFKNRLPLVPLSKGQKLISPNKKIKLGRRMFSLQGAQRFQGKGRPRALQLAVVDDNTRHVFKGQARHGQPVLRRAERPGLVPGLPGWNDVEGIERELLQRRLGQRDMGQVRRVKGTAKDAYSLRY